MRIILDCDFGSDDYSENLELLDRIIGHGSINFHKETALGIMPNFKGVNITYINPVEVKGETK